MGLPGMVERHPEAYTVDDDPPGSAAREIRRDPEVYLPDGPCNRLECDGTIMSRPSDSCCTNCDYFEAPGKCNRCLADLVKIDEKGDDGWEHMPHTVVMGCPNDCGYTKEHEQNYP